MEFSYFQSDKNSIKRFFPFIVNIFMQGFEDEVFTKLDLGILRNYDCYVDDNSVCI